MINKSFLFLGTGNFQPKRSIYQLQLQDQSQKARQA